MIGDRRGGRLVGWGASITAVLLERGLQNNTQLNTASHTAWQNTKYCMLELGETILFSCCVGRQDYVNEVSKWGEGELWGEPQLGAFPACSHLCSVQNILKNKPKKKKIRSAKDLGQRSLGSWE